MKTPQRSDTQSQTKQTIYNVYNYFKKLSSDESNPVVAEFFRRAQEKTAEACGVSQSTVKRVTSEGNRSVSRTGSGPTFAAPRATYKREKRVFDLDVVRRIVTDSSYHGGECPTLTDVLTAYRLATGVSAGSRASMSRVLKSIGFVYKKRNDGRRVLAKRGGPDKATTPKTFDEH